MDASSLVGIQEPGGFTALRELRPAIPGPEQLIVESASRQEANAAVGACTIKTLDFKVGKSGVLQEVRSGRRDARVRMRLERGLGAAGGLGGSGAPSFGSPPAIRTAAAAIAR